LCSKGLALQRLCPAPSPVLACPALSWQAVAFSAGGDGGRRSPDIKRNPHTTFAAASDCRTIAIYEFTT